MSVGRADIQLFPKTFAITTSQCGNNSDVKCVSYGFSHNTQIY